MATLQVYQEIGYSFPLTGQESIEKICGIIVEMMGNMHHLALRKHGGTQNLAVASCSHGIYETVEPDGSRVKRIVLVMIFEERP
jgi:hypothetical protein